MSTPGFVVWLTGLSGAGKTTIATSLADRLRTQRPGIELLDGDTVRQTLCRDLGFSKEDRAKNIERVGYVAAMLSKHGVGVIASFISPYQRERDLVRSQCTNFIEVYVNAPLAVCEERDPKGLYKKARAGEIEQFTGISDPYEAPQEPELEIMTDDLSVDASVRRIEQYLLERSLVVAAEGARLDRKW